MTADQRSYAEILRVNEPSLEVAARSRSANWFGLLIAALIEKGSAMRLEEVAERLEEIGYADAESARRSLTRCRPDREPVFRVDELYDLDPHSEEARLWAFKLDLRPPQWQLDQRKPLHKSSPTLPAPRATDPITRAALEEAWRIPGLSGWSKQRLAICALEALGGRASPQDLRDLLAARGWHEFNLLPDDHPWHAKAPIRIGEDGAWEFRDDHPAIASARAAVARAVEADRERRRYDVSPTEVEERRARDREEDRAVSERLATMRRVLLAAFPPEAPRILGLLDVSHRSHETYMEGEFPEALRRLESFDCIAAVDVRSLLNRLGFAWGERTLADLAPPQKSIRLGRAKKTQKIDLALLLESSCGIRRGLGDPKKMRASLEQGDIEKVRRRLEGDLESLFALYQYGLTQRALRLRRGRHDEMIGVSWVDWREPSSLCEIRKAALREDRALEVVLDKAPEWESPWARAECVLFENRSENAALFDLGGWFLDDRNIQIARLGPPAAEVREQFELRMLAAEAEAWSEQDSVAVAERVEDWIECGHEAETAEEAIEAYEKAVETAAADLGTGIFEDGVGAFWGLLETRPYMRARSALAHACRDAGKWDEAAQHYRELLRLSKNDNLGIRYSLLPHLIRMGRLDEAQTLVETFDENGAHWLFPKALLAYAQERSRDEVVEAMTRALKSNAFVLPMLTGEIETPEDVGGYGIGDEYEAASVIEVGFEAWEAHKGALHFLMLCALL